MRTGNGYSLMKSETKITWQIVVIVIMLLGGNEFARYRFNQELGDRYLLCPWCDKIMKYKESRRAYDANMHPPGYWKTPVDDWFPMPYETADGYQNKYYEKEVKIYK